jgi:2-phosphosulfolactate phosphatase
VVFDILRATSTFVTALHHGAKEIVPVSEISEAVARRQADPHCLLAGERDGVKIRAAQSGGVDFDLGNSPHEFSLGTVEGRSIVSTTTNGTRALRACAGAKHVLAAAYLNLSATARFLLRQKPTEILLVCAGTGENPATEDIIVAGGLVECNSQPEHPELTRNSLAAKTAFGTNQKHLLDAFRHTQNGARLFANPELREDVSFCAQRDIYDLVAVMNGDGAIRRVGSK